MFSRHQLQLWLQSCSHHWLRLVCFFSFLHSREKLSLISYSCLIIMTFQWHVLSSGPAGLVCAETLRQEGFTDRIVMCTMDRHPPYDRPKLSKVCTQTQILYRETEILEPTKRKSELCGEQLFILQQQDRDNAEINIKYVLTLPLKVYPTACYHQHRK